MLQSILSYQLWSNTGQDYLIALAIFIGVLMILKIFKSVVIVRLRKIAKKTKTDLDDALISIISGIKKFSYFIIALYIGIKALSFPELVDKVIYVIFVIILAYEAIKAAQKIIEYGAKKMMAKKNGDAGEDNEATIRTLSIFVKIALWSIGLILILSNLGINVSSLIAGLGIGGIAVALALQNVLGDMFASFSIIIDKPFQVGDFIKVGDDMGTVEKIGIKTTRLRSLVGEELIISNKELTSARVQNFKKLEKRRIAFDLGIIYETPKAKLEKIPDIIKGIINSVDNAEFDRCHFKSFDDFSLHFETVYFIDSSDYVEYMNVNQAINLKIFEAFGQEGIEFAYPTHLEYQKKLGG